MTCAFWGGRPGQADSVAICMSRASLVAVLGKRVCSYLHDLRISGCSAGNADSVAMCMTCASSSVVLRRPDSLAIFATCALLGVVLGKQIQSAFA